MNGVNKKEKETTTEIVTTLLQYIFKNHPTEVEVLDILSTLMYNVGSHLNRANGIDKEYKLSEDIMSDFATNPSVANALMGQALVMKDVWLKNEGK